MSAIQEIHCLGNAILPSIEGKYHIGFVPVPFPSPREPRFTFIDLFAGMGGFRLAMQAQGGRCVFSSEIYLENVKNLNAA